MLEPGGTKDNLFPPFYCTNLIHKTRKKTAKGGTKEQLNAVSSSSNSHVKKKALRIRQKSLSAKIINQTKAGKQSSSSKKRL